MMLDTVVVPLDGSAEAERALAPAAALARRCGAEVTLLTVALDERQAERSRSYLAARVATLDVATREPRVVVGLEASDSIVEAGDTPGAVVVMTTHGSSGLRRAVLGSTAEDTVRRLHRPVVLIGPACRTEHTFEGEHAVVALDGSPRADEIIPVAGQWCRLLGLRPWAVTVVDPDEPQLVPGPTETAHVRVVAEQWEAEGIPASWEVMHGPDPVEPLVTFVLGLPTTMVMLTTRGRTGVGRFILGSVATSVTREVECPVLVLRPGEHEPGDTNEGSTP